MSTTVVHFYGLETLSQGLAKQLGANYCSAEIHEFPDGETCVRIDPQQINKQTIVVASLHHPNHIVLPLLFLSETLRDYGAEHILLIAPYLAYMRQDRRFHEGEGISARYFAGLISTYFDALVTVDPHLHRIKSLDKIYSVPSRVIHAAPQVADWIRNNIDKPLLIGPDSESEQWVKDVAHAVGAPFVVLQKTRHGDRDVEISVPDVEKWHEHTPVLVDDIISTAKTMIKTVKHLNYAGLKAPICIGIHGIFADKACQELIDAGASKVITSNSISHETNAIDLVPSITVTVRELLA